MLDLGELEAAPRPRLSRATLGQVGERALPWLVALGVESTALLKTGTPALDIARYDM